MKLSEREREGLFNDSDGDTFEIKESECSQKLVAFMDWRAECVGLFDADTVEKMGHHMIQLARVIHARGAAALAQAVRERAARGN